MNSSQFLVIDMVDVLLAVMVILAVGVDREGAYLVGSRRDVVAFEDFIPTLSFPQELCDLFAKEPRSCDILARRITLRSGKIHPRSNLSS